jgi:hypothetical protein
MRTRVVARVQASREAPLLSFSVVLCDLCLNPCLLSTNRQGRHAMLIERPAPLPIPTILLRPAVQGIAWMVLSGIIFGVLIALLRVITLQLPPIEAQFLRCVSGALVMLPFILRVGFCAYNPNGLKGQLWRGAAHTSGMLLWFMALPHLPLADTTTIGVTGPILVMI